MGEVKKKASNNYHLTHYSLQLMGPFFHVVRLDILRNINKNTPFKNAHNKPQSCNEEEEEAEEKT